MFKRNLEKLEQSIKELNAQGDKKGEVTKRRQKLFLNLLNFDMAGYLHESTRITLLTEGRNSPRYAQGAHATLSLGQQMAQWFPNSETTRRLFTQAAALYQDLGQPAEQAEALKRLAIITITGHKFQTALDQLNQALAALGNQQERNPVLAAELYGLRANCRVNLQDVAQGRRDLDQAAALAKKSGNSMIIRQTELERQSLAKYLAQ